MPITERQSEGLAAFAALGALVYAGFVLAAHLSFGRHEVPYASQGPGMEAVALTVDGRDEGMYFIPRGTAVSDMAATFCPGGCGMEDRKVAEHRLRSGDRVSIVNETIMRVERMSAVQALAVDLPLDINSMTLSDLMLIPGIGEKTAQKILDLREQKGHYRNLEELMEIKGIKEKKLGAFRRYLFVEKEP